MCKPWHRAQKTRSWGNLSDDACLCRDRQRAQEQQTNHIIDRRLLKNRQLQTTKEPCLRLPLEGFAFDLTQHSKHSLHGCSEEWPDISLQQYRSATHHRRQCRPATQTSLKGGGTHTPNTISASKPTAAPPHSGTLAEDLMKFCRSPEVLRLGGCALRERVMASMYRQGAFLCRLSCHQTRPSRLAPAAANKSKLAGAP